MLAKKLKIWKNDEYVAYGKYKTILESTEISNHTDDTKEIVELYSDYNKHRFSIIEDVKMALIHLYINTYKPVYANSGIEFKYASVDDTKMVTINVKNEKSLRVLFLNAICTVLNLWGGYVNTIYMLLTYLTRVADILDKSSNYTCATITTSLDESVIYGDIRDENIGYNTIDECCSNILLNFMYNDMYPNTYAIYNESTEYHMCIADIMNYLAGNKSVVPPGII